jgi:hypothetical protein
MPRRVAQRLPLFQEIKSARSWPAVHAQTPVLEQALEHADHLEHLRALVLVDEVELGRRMQLTRHDAVVEVRTDMRIPHLLEGDRALAAEADEVKEAVARRYPVRIFLHQLGEAILELLFVLTTLLERQSRELVAAETLPQALERFGMLDGHRSAPQLNRGVLVSCGVPVTSSAALGSGQDQDPPSVACVQEMPPAFQPGWPHRPPFPVGPGACAPLRPRLPAR